MTPDGSIRTDNIQIICKGGRAGASEMRVTVTAHLLGFGILYSGHRLFFLSLLSLLLLLLLLLLPWAED